jgi:Flp pilus assembly protein TadG
MLLNRLHRLRRNQRGSAMVESSLIMMVLFAIVIGIFDVAQVMYVHQGITERVRAALRYGTVNSYNESAIRNVVLYGQTAAPTGAQPSFGLTAGNVSVSRLGNNTSADRIVITVTNYSYEFLSPWIAGARTGTPITNSLPYEGVQ